MGYYTRFEIIHIKEPNIGAFLKALDADGIRYDDAVKWYNHEINVVQAMKVSGATEVMLHGMGEEHADVWDKEFTLQKDHIMVKGFLYQRNSEPSKEKVYPLCGSASYKEALAKVQP